MSELLNNLNQPSGEQPKSFMQEVQEAAADYKEPEATPEPVAEAEPEPEPVVEAAPEPVAPPAPVQERDEDRKVSLKALQEERQKRQEIERRLAQMEAWFQQNQPQQPPEQYAEPDPETDPIAALKYTKQQIAEMRQMEQARSQENQFRNVYAQDAQRFASETPDFGPAYQYVIQSRAQELEAIGMPPDRITQIVQAEEMNLVATAMQNGVRPAEAIYKFAKARGYSGAKPAPAPAPAPVAAPPALQAERQAVSATPAAAANKPGSSAPVTLEAIAGLKGAAFDSAFNKYFYGKNEGSMFRR
jgi:hypothetical protein